MSNYSKFLDDLNDFYKDRKSKGIIERISNDDALAVVRDKWLQDGRFKELISFILENWDSGNCDDFMKPLVDTLLKNGETNLFKVLWKGILRYRIEEVWDYNSDLKKRFPKFTIEDLTKINLADFNQFSSKEDVRRRVAFHRQYTLNGISVFIGGLKFLNQTEEIERANELYKTISTLQKPVPKPSTDKRKIDEVIFWQLIGKSRHDTTDQFEFIEKLKQALETFKPEELRKFQKLLLIKQQELNSWEHWALAYIARRGCGDDEFDYFKFWAVSKGQKDFEAIKQLDTKRLKDIFDEDPQLEDFLYLTESVYEEKTGEIMKEVKVKELRLTGKKWNEENITKNFPIFCEIFNYAG
jgi:hypothetical protein